MEEFAARYLEVTVNPDKLAAARAVKPMYERQTLGRTVLLFDGADRNKLAPLGELRTPGISDVFVAVMTSPETQAAQ
jgi:ABC-2 type transport system ATP-binding protein